MTATQKRPANRTTGGASSSRTTWIVGGAIVLMVALVAVIAVLASGGGDDEASSTTAPGTEEMRSVEVDGSPLPELPREAADPAVGTPAPTVRGSAFDGSPLSIEPGSPTLITFLAHWCPHCQREVPVLTDWAADGGVPEGVNVIGVATATNDGQPNYPPSAWLAREEFPFPVIADDANFSAGKAFGLSGFPFFVLLDDDGTVAWRGTGELDPGALAEVLSLLPD